MDGTRSKRRPPTELARTLVACVCSVGFLLIGCGGEARPASNYLIGAGAADITGPIVDVEFPGYSRSTHIAHGIQTRLTARAFIVGELDESRRLVLVVTDLLYASHEVRLSVVEALQAKYGDLYSLDNVVVSATHTHSAPAGYVHEGRFREPFFAAVVAGVVEAIDTAHESLSPGYILIGEEEVEGGGAQRSLPAYLQNPEAERARYEHDTDRQMTLLKFVQDDGTTSVLNWFAVHPTALTYDSKFVSGDHKGHAALEMERRLSAENSGQPLVAAFANSNCGDVTANLNLDNTGPGKNDLDSARIIGQRQLDTALSLFDSVSKPLSGRVDARITAVDMNDVEVSDAFTGAGPQKTCPAARGYSFAAGSTEDGGGNPVFVEGMLMQDPIIDQLVQDALGTKPPSEEVLACHAPKPILWTETRDPMPIGVATIGQLALVFIPGEITTMAGRRMRETVRNVLGDRSEHVVIAAYSNDHSGYITTPEEYDAQQYEGGHTVYGKWTLPAYQQEIDRVARALASDEPVTNGADPGDRRGTVKSTAIGNEFDEPPAGASFGDVVEALQASYAQGETMSVSFWTGHPDNALRDIYFEIQRRDGSEWRTVATENDWFTRAKWVQASRVFPPLDPFNPFPDPPPPLEEAFTARVIWQIRDAAEVGTYRVVFHGSERPEPGADVRLFAAESPSFEVVRAR